MFGVTGALGQFVVELFCQFGYGSDMDGVLLLVSVGDRKWHISTCGYGITAFTDAGIQYLGEQMTPDMADGDYAAAFRTFIRWTDAYVTAAREGHPYDVDNMPKEPFSIVYLGVALVMLLTGAEGGIWLAIIPVALANGIGILALGTWLGGKLMDARMLSIVATLDSFASLQK